MKPSYTELKSADGITSKIDTNPELKDYYYKMWSAYKQWYKDYDASPKMKIDLERYDLEDPKNVDAVLAMIDERLKSLR